MSQNFMHCRIMFDIGKITNLEHKLHRYQKCTFTLIMKKYLYYFFFSSRRRHTRWNCDWSSDVCSSDLALGDASDCACPGVARIRCGVAGCAGHVGPHTGDLLSLRLHAEPGDSVCTDLFNRHSGG